jgi:hypothetical protein
MRLARDWRAAVRVLPLRMLQQQVQLVSAK